MGCDFLFLLLLLLHQTVEETFQLIIIEGTLYFVPLLLDILLKYPIDV